LELIGIRKRFGDLLAVDGVDLALAPGEVHAVLGENGAGKTTLMNIVAGFIAPDAGRIELGGETRRFAGPRDALAVGIGMVHQHFRLVEKFTVAENLALGRHDVPQLLKRRVLADRVAALSDRYGLTVNPTTPVWRLSIGEQQRVEILRALGGGAEILILDEPTSVLTPQESEGLCATLREMAASGKTIVFISHKLQEVLDVSDRITVMRSGRRLDTLEREDCDAQMLARLMIGEDTRDVRLAAPGGASGARKLAAQNLSVEDERGHRAVRDLNLAVHGGEILGIAGVAGNGQGELAEVLTGLRRPTAGSVTVGDRQVGGRSPRFCINAGISYIPEDRRGTGLIATEPIWVNATLKRYRRPPISRGPIVRAGEAKRFAAELARRVSLSTDDVDKPAGQLSGGNLQKLLVGRELGAGSEVVIATSPTQGLDVGAAENVWQALLDARAAGVAVLLISYDLDEVLRLSDRVAVLYEGAIVGEFAGDEVDRDRIGLLMGGFSGDADDG
jgi:simple sugar transport system ATP-binding protein